MILLSLAVACAPPQPRNGAAVGTIQQALDTSSVSTTKEPVPLPPPSVRSALIPSAEAFDSTV